MINQSNISVCFELFLYSSVSFSKYILEYQQIGSALPNQIINKIKTQFET